MFLVVGLVGKSKQKATLTGKHFQEHNAIKVMLVWVLDAY
jgi:hypothetical protein